MARGHRPVQLRVYRRRLAVKVLLTVIELQFNLRSPETLSLAQPRVCSVQAAAHTPGWMSFPGQFCRHSEVNGDQSTCGQNSKKEIKTPVLAAPVLNGAAH
jgi:hypothetical protein